jgi:hypothetical protein
VAPQLKAGSGQRICLNHGARRSLVCLRAKHPFFLVGGSQPPCRGHQRQARGGERQRAAPERVRERMCAITLKLTWHADVQTSIKDAIKNFVSVPSRQIRESTRDARPLLVSLIAEARAEVWYWG